MRFRTSKGLALTKIGMCWNFTTQPYRLYVVRIFSSSKPSVTHISNSMHTFFGFRLGAELHTATVRVPHISEEGYHEHLKTAERVTMMRMGS